MSVLIGFSSGYAERERWEEIEARHRAAQTGTEVTETDWHGWWDREILHDLPPNITRVRSWEAIIDWFKSGEGRKALVG
jgi:hypothetical protein